MIKFRAMRDSEFERFKENSLRSFAAANVASGNWDEESAFGKAGQMLDHLLTAGLETPGHRLLIITDLTNEIGTLWIYLNSSTRKAFLFDIEIFSKFRGSGCGSRTMDQLEKTLAAENIQQIELHVFAHNAPARALYLKKGYLETDVTMRKNL